MSLESENFAGGGRTDIRGVLRGPKGGRGGQPSQVPQPTLRQLENLTKSHLSAVVSLSQAATTVWTNLELS